MGSLSVHEQCGQKIFSRIPKKIGKIPQNIPHSKKNSQFWGKVCFIAFLLTNILNEAKKFRIFDKNLQNKKILYQSSAHIFKVENKKSKFF